MIDKNSRLLLAAIYVFALALGIVLFVFVKNPWIVWPLTAILLWFCLWQLFFFHVPQRERAGGSNSVSAVSDGKIVICEKVFESEVLKRECFQVSVYMNFFDVHANFWPVSGEVKLYRYNPGKHLFAFNPKSSLDNEHTCVVLDVNGKDVMFKQIAGGFARRIVCYASEGERTRAGEQCGIIKFGSRIDYLLPLEAEIKVALGQMVRACETVIAEL